MICSVVYYFESCLETKVHICTKLESHELELSKILSAFIVENQKIFPLYEVKYPPTKTSTIFLPDYVVEEW